MILAAREVAKTFSRNGKDAAALDGFSLTVAEGEFSALVGPSGCGKSTSFISSAGSSGLTAARWP